MEKNGLIKKIVSLILVGVITASSVIQNVHAEEPHEHNYVTVYEKTNLYKSFNSINEQIDESVTKGYKCYERCSICGEVKENTTKYSLQHDPQVSGFNISPITVQIVNPSTSDVEDTVTLTTHTFTDIDGNEVELKNSAFILAGKRAHIISATPNVKERTISDDYYDAAKYNTRLNVKYDTIGHPANYYHGIKLSNTTFATYEMSNARLIASNDVLVSREVLYKNSHFYTGEPVNLFHCASVNKSGYHETSKTSAKFACVDENTYNILKQADFDKTAVESANLTWTTELFFNGGNEIRPYGGDFKAVYATDFTSDTDKAIVQKTEIGTYYMIVDFIDYGYYTFNDKDEVYSGYSVEVKKDDRMYENNSYIYDFDTKVLKPGIPVKLFSMSHRTGFNHPTPYQNIPEENVDMHYIFLTPEEKNALDFGAVLAEEFINNHSANLVSGYPATNSGGEYTPLVYAVYTGDYSNVEPYIGYKTVSVNYPNAYFNITIENNGNITHNNYKPNLSYGYGYWDSNLGKDVFPTDDSFIHNEVFAYLTKEEAEIFKNCFKTYTVFRGTQPDALNTKITLTDEEFRTIYLGNAFYDSSYDKYYIMEGEQKIYFTYSLSDPDREKLIRPLLDNPNRFLSYEDFIKQPAVSWNRPGDGWSSYKDFVIVALAKNDTFNISSVRGRFGAEFESLEATSIFAFVEGSYRIDELLLNVKGNKGMYYDGQHHNAVDFNNLDIDTINFNDNYPYEDGKTYEDFKDDTVIEYLLLTKEECIKYENAPYKTLLYAYDDDTYTTTSLVAELDGDHFGDHNLDNDNYVEWGWFEAPNGQRYMKYTYKGHEYIGPIYLIFLGYTQQNEILSSFSDRWTTTIPQVKEVGDYYILIKATNPAYRDSNIARQITYIVDHKPATCTEDGLTYGHSSPEIIKAFGHNAGAPVQENYVAPTCTEEGSYDLVTYCCNWNERTHETCHAELSRTHYTIPISDHNYTDYRTVVETEPTCTTAGTSRYEAYCPDCDKWILINYVTVNALGHREHTNTYQLRAVTCTQDDAYVDITSCDRCGEILNVDYYTMDEATGHEMELSEKVLPTCTKDGYEVYTCKHTHAVKTEDMTVNNIEVGVFDGLEQCDYTYKVTLPALGHINGAPVIENKVEPTVETEGGYDEVVYCERCHAELSRTHYTIDKLKAGHEHSYNLVDSADPTCEVKGYKKYECECGDSYFSYTDALGHIKGEPVTENYVEAKVGVDGYYDEVIYCERCNKELSRVRQTLPAIKVMDIPNKEVQKVPVKKAPEVPKVQKVQDNNVKTVVIVSTVVSLTGGGTGAFFLVFWRRKRRVRGTIIGEDSDGLYITLRGKDNLETYSDKDGGFEFKNLKHDTLLLEVHNREDEVIFSCEIYTKGKSDEEIFTVIENKVSNFEFYRKGRTFSVTIEM